MSVLVLIFTILLTLTSVLLGAMVIAHKGRGGGMSDLFGGGMSTSMGGSSVAERQLDRLTVIIGVAWFACIITLGLLYRFEL